MQRDPAGAAGEARGENAAESSFFVGLDRVTRSEGDANRSHYNHASARRRDWEKYGAVAARVLPSNGKKYCIVYAPTRSSLRRNSANAARAIRSHLLYRNDRMQCFTARRGRSALSFMQMNLGN